MKKINDLKIYIKMSLVIGLVIMIGLGSIYGIINSRTRSIMRKQTEIRLSEITESRSVVIEKYFSDLQNYVVNFAKLPAVVSYMQNTSDKTAANNVQETLLSYTSTRSDIESMYLADDATLVYAHTDPSFIGQVANAEMAGFTANIESAGGAMCAGIVLSPASNSNVAIVFANVHDASGKPIGFVGGATYVDELQNTITGMSTQGLDGAQMYLIGSSDITAATYIFAPDPAMLGAPVEDEAQVQALQQMADVPTSFFTYRDKTLGRSILSYRNIPSVAATFIVTDSEKDFLKDINSLSNFILFLVILVFCVSLVGVVLISKAISKDIEGVTEVITDLGTLDITKTQALEKYKGRNDEVGLIADATKKLSSAVERTIKSLRRHSGDLQNGSGKLRENSESTLESIGQVDIAVHDIAQSATEQSDETKNATDSVKEIGVMVEETKEKTMQLKEASQSMQDSSKKAGEILKELGEVNEKTKTAVDAMYEQTAQTSHSADQISKASELIASIATQTNLLSLNASIEAARAGDAGRGFAVVAGEIGSLASQTADTTKEINDIIQQLIDNSKRSIEAMDEVKKIIDMQNEYVQQTKEIFGSVEGEIANNLDSIDEISSTVQRLDDVRSSVVNVVESLSTIAETNAATTQETSASTSVVSNMMEEVSTIATQISDIAAGVKKDIDVFKISE
ncbi:methyl-accepting chemotaxis protein [Butyrivibrio hungatei]|uniref:methyl-accepting chemotaxis protein n=1 Tax=Butyrivibrio hungatei TaxID=185008 RepID=UPI000429CBAB|nr:methyl-accepting chemotaxis protein [Butyrivibrio hungatei]